jgi:two-component sensor histidine kinase
MRARPLLRDSFGRALSIRALLVALALALMLPTLGFAGFLLWRVAENEEAWVTEAAQATAQRVVASVDLELTGFMASLRALATSPSLDTGDLAAFQAQADQARAVAAGEIVLWDRRGRQLLSGRVVSGQGDDGDAVGRDKRARVLQTRESYVSDVLSGTTERPFVSVYVPVIRGGEAAYVLGARIRPEHWLQILQQHVTSTVASAGLVDKNGVFIARLRHHEQFVGRPAGTDLRNLPTDRGAVTRRNVEGQKVLFAYDRSGLSHWLVGVGVPTDVLRAPLRRSVMILIAVGSALLALSVVLALAFGARIARPIRALSASAARLGRGERVQPLSTGLREVNEVGLSLSAVSIGLRERSAALRVSEERYRFATEAFQGSVFDFDVVRNHSERTPRHYEILGEVPGAIPTTKEGWHERIHPEDRAVFQRARRSMYEGGAPQYEAEYRVRHRSGSWVWVWHRALAMRDDTGAVRRVVGAILDITARRHAEEHLKLLVNELNHRVKNTLATVQSIAIQTLRGARTVDEARGAFEARLIALSNAHNILTRENWEGADLRSIVAEALDPFRSRWADRFVVEGPEVWVSPANAVSIAMGLHELSTNAVKYGALSNETGIVKVAWIVEMEAGCPRVRLTWTEAGGPPVAPPLRRGFGSRLIERSLAADLGGEARLEYRPTGVVCTLTWALDVDGAVAMPRSERAFAVGR